MMQIKNMAAVSSKPSIAGNAVAGEPTPAEEAESAVAISAPEEVTTAPVEETAAPAESVAVEDPEAGASEVETPTSITGGVEVGATGTTAGVHPGKGTVPITVAPETPVTTPPGTVVPTTPTPPPAPPAEPVAAEPGTEATLEAPPVTEETP